MNVSVLRSWRLNESMKVVKVNLSTYFTKVQRIQRCDKKDGSSWTDFEPKSGEVLEPFNGLLDRN